MIATVLIILKKFKTVVTDYNSNFKPKIIITNYGFRFFVILILYMGHKRIRLSIILKHLLLYIYIYYFIFIYIYIYICLFGQSSI